MNFYNCTEKKLLNQGKIKYIGGYIRDVGYNKMGEISVGPRCYLMAILAFELVKDRV